MSEDIVFQPDNGQLGKGRNVYLVRHCTYKYIFVF